MPIAEADAIITKIRWWLDRVGRVVADDESFDADAVENLCGLAERQVVDIAQLTNALAGLAAAVDALEMQGEDDLDPLVAALFAACDELGTAPDVGWGPDPRVSEERAGADTTAALAALPKKPFTAAGVERLTQAVHASMAKGEKT